MGYLGRSGVALPFKGAITRLESSEEEMRVVDIDLDILRVCRVLLLASVVADLLYNRMLVLCTKSKRI